MLIDRERELAVLDRALADCLRGTPRTVLIEGAVGCGKSELVETVAERAAASGAVVLRAIGTAVERDLPLGVLGQLLSAAPAGALPDPAAAPDPSRIDVMQSLCAAVHRLAEAAPVVICVDDLHHSDDLSRQYLLHLIRRTRAARVLLVCAESVHERGDDPVHGTELLRQRGFLRIRAERLRPEAVSRLAAAELAAGPADGRNSPPTDAAGGNPLLLRALFEEHRAGGPAPEPGGAFTQAVLACLHRCGPAARRLAEVLAVLGELGSRELAVRLLGSTEDAVVRGSAALDAAGILDGYRFRHAGARQAVLDRMDPDDRTALHRRAAELAHHGGAPTAAVAAQLLAAGPTDLPWAVTALATAAEQLLADGATDLAAACLELAYRGRVDDGQRAQFRTKLAAITWRTNPSAAERDLAGPLETLRAGRLDPARLGPLARLLTEQGRIDEACQALERLAAGREAERTGRPARLGRGTDPLDGLSAFPWWAGSARPGAGTRPGEPLPARIPAPATLWAIPEYAADGVAGVAAETFLRAATLGEGTAAPIVQALRALLATDGPSRVLPWCQVFAQEAVRRGAPGWQTAFTALHAEALLRQGDLTGAQQQAEAALDLLPERGGSAFAGGVAATLIRAATAAGRHDTAARELSRPLPEGLAGSIHGLAHLRARGQYHLATHRFHAALGDFLDIGRSLKRWGLDRPLLMPWRTGAAEALIRLGEAPQAARFIAEQLAHRDAAHPWISGLTLRVRAALCEPRERQALLARAVDELHGSEDRYELARTLAEFAGTLEELGDGNRARMVARRACQLAKECGAHALREQLAPGLGEPGGPSEDTRPDRVDPARLHARLSDSEKRVAMLAVHGHTNREIAMKLHITVSTVEQHLTRIYRKLNITRRQELPVEFHLLDSAGRV
ncbi:AAA family ATPase [Kitasatospora sp. RB6PN24]|uniref:helix-turn-helix transcriptional regulator n=1 Tax=Kitasatospora humi TaxID=2893891 RepID=UPI001E53A9C6|nr:helix-turn-helix transcriptional regulator [Kitasatospora humi]MCC9311471.1 AAA family ATPase [Kitasatospora humi]